MSIRKDVAKIVAVSVINLIFAYFIKSIFYGYNLPDIVPEYIKAPEILKYVITLTIFLLILISSTVLAFSIDNIILLFMSPILVICIHQFISLPNCIDLLGEYGDIAISVVAYSVLLVMTIIKYIFYGLFFAVFSIKNKDSRKVKDKKEDKKEKQKHIEKDIIDSKKESENIFEEFINSEDEGERAGKFI